MEHQITWLQRSSQAKVTTNLLIGKYSSIGCPYSANFSQVVSGHFDLRNVVWLHTFLGWRFANEDL